MNELTLEQTDKITRFVQRHEIVFSHLCDDLIDHICCDLEESIRNGADFDEAYRQLRSRIGKTGLRSIQEETLYIVDSKYRKMKVIMKLSGIAGTVLLGLATVFKIQHWPMAGAMFALGALMLIILFLPSSLMVLWKESKSGKRIFLFFTAFISSALFIIGVLFKIQHWPGASIALTLGVLTGIIFLLPALVYNTVNDPDRITPRWIYYIGGAAFALYGAGFLLKIMHWPGASLLLMLSILIICLLIVPLYIYNRWKNDEHVSAKALIIIATVMIFITPTALLSFNVSPSFEQMFMVTSELNSRNLEFRITRNNELLKQYGLADNEDIATLHKATESLFDQIDKIENTLLPSGTPGIEPEDLPSDLQREQLFNYTSTLEVFAPEGALITDLEDQLKAYTKMLSLLEGVNMENEIFTSFDLDRYLPPDIVFYDGVPYLAPVALVQSLGLLKGFILDAEASAIRDISSDLNLTN